MKVLLLRKLKTAEIGLKTSALETRQWRRFVRINTLTILILLALILASLLLGPASLTAQDVYSGLFSQSTGTTEYDILWNLRLPRTLLAVLIGAHFALAGLILQVVIRNPIADPSVIGISSGASLAIVIFLLLMDYVNDILLNYCACGLSLSWLPIAAFIGGLLTAVFVLSMSWQAGISPAKLALNGVAVGAVLNAAVMWIVVVWGGGRTETTILWLAGSLYARDFTHIAMILPWTLAGLFALLTLLRPLSLLRFNDDLANSLGLNLHFWRIFSIIVAVTLASSAIAVAGPVGFVGLVIPHLARLLVGSQIRYLALTSLTTGACLTLGADLLSRMLLIPLELPVGTLTTLIGIPIFLVLLQRQSQGSK